MLSFPSKEVPGKLHNPNLEMQKECCYVSLKIKFILELHSKLLIDYITVAQQFILLLVIKNILGFT